MSKKLYLSPDVGTPLLTFLWKWKLVTTAALSQKFFSQIRPLSAYNRLLDLRLAKYLAYRTNQRGEYHLWSLDKVGFNAIRDLLPDLREEGYGSEASLHDWLCSAFHIGEWLIEAPSGVVTVSEQELRRFDPEHYPSWIPKSTQHRPDGYWGRAIEQQWRTIALEMELSMKKPSSYQSIGTFYGESAQVNRVLWVVRTQKSASDVLAQIEKAPGSRPKIHSFVLVDAFLKNGWSAKIEYGSGKDLMVESFLRKALSCSENEFTVNSKGMFLVNSLLETRKTGFILGTSGIRREIDFSI